MTTIIRDHVQSVLQQKCQITPDLGLQVHYYRIYDDAWRIEVTTSEMRDDEGISKHEIRYFLSLSETYGLYIGINVDSETKQQYITLY